MESKVRQREIFLDKLRVAATCAVVLLHTVTGVMDNCDMNPFPVEKKVFLTVMDLVCWSVPVFLLISGYLFLNPEREISFRTMITKYCRRIVLALILFGVPYACLEQIAAERHFRPGMLWDGFIMVLKGQSWSHMWYLYFIFFLYLLTPALKFVLKRLSRQVLWLLLGVLFLGGSILPFAKGLSGAEQLPALPDGSIYFFYYICGYLFAWGRRSGLQGEKADGAVSGSEKEFVSDGAVSGLEKKPASDGAVSGLEREAAADVRRVRIGKAARLMSLCLAAAMAVSRIAGFSFQMAYNYPFTAALALLLFAWGIGADKSGQREKAPAEEKEPGVQRRENFSGGNGIMKNNVFWEKASALSFGVYLIHPVFLNIYYKFLHVTPLDFPIGVSLPLFFLAALLPAALGAWVLRKVPVMRRYVL